MKIHYLFIFIIIIVCILFIYYYYFNFTILYWFCHTSTWIHHGCTCVPHPEPLSHIPSHPIPLDHPSAPALSILYHASNLDWQFVSHMIICMFQCHSPKSSHPRSLPQSPKDCSIRLCLLLSRIRGYRYHLSKFHIYALVYSSVFLLITALLLQFRWCVSARARQAGPAGVRTLGWSLH